MDQQQMQPDCVCLCVNYEECGAMGEKIIIYIFFYQGDKSWSKRQQQIFPYLTLAIIIRSYKLQNLPLDQNNFFLISNAKINSTVDSLVE